MTFFSWFGKKAPAPESVPSQGFGPGPSDTTLPMHMPPQSRGQGAKSADAAGTRVERMERRELLYRVVRECMTGAGVLSSTYKFKVLSLDATGLKYLIMMDVPQAQVLQPAALTEIEGTIARSAKQRFGILVTAVYWRVNEMVTAGQRPQTPVRAAAPIPAGAVPVAVDSDVQLAQEMLAFKRSTASADAGASAGRPGEMLRSGRRNPEPEPDFSDTERIDAHSPLGPSQFGGLS